MAGENPIGFSFSPSAGLNERPEFGGQGLAGNTPQSAIKLLQLRPKLRHSDRAPIAPQLIAGNALAPGRGGSFTDQWLTQLFGQGRSGGSMQDVLAALAGSFGGSPGLPGVGHPGSPGNAPGGGQGGGQGPIGGGGGFGGNYSPTPPAPSFGFGDLFQPGGVNV